MSRPKFSEFVHPIRWDRQVNRAARRYGFTSEEKEELRQSAALLVLEQKERFEHSARKAVWQEAARMQRERNRRASRETSLELEQEMTAPVRTDAVLAVEVSEVLDRMPESLRRFCEKLMVASPGSVA